MHDAGRTAQITVQGVGKGSAVWFGNTACFSLGRPFLTRTGFFLGQSADWRERVLLRLYRPLFLADFGYGVLDAMVETAAYVIRSLTHQEQKQLIQQLLPDWHYRCEGPKGLVRHFLFL